MSDVVKIWADGACKGNPGVGGWGVLLQYRDVTKQIYGGERLTTNNQMELTAAIQSLQVLKRPCDVRLYTDSNYVVQGMTSWVKSWKNNHWRTSTSKPVKNVQLWQMLDQLASQHNIKWIWVKGHSDNSGNIKADELANLGCAQYISEG